MHLSKEGRHIHSSQIQALACKVVCPTHPIWIGRAPASQSSGVNLARSLGDRESGRRNFRFQTKKFKIFRKNLRFTRPKIPTTLFLVFSHQLKKLSFLPKYSHF